MQAIILAAGYATRLFPLTKDFPKALLSVGGKPMLDHLVEALDRIEDVKAIHVVSNSRFYPHFERWASKHCVRKLQVWDDGTSEDGTKLGAIGDMDFVRRNAGIAEDCLVVAGDNLLMIDYGDFCREFARRRAPLLLCQRQESLEILRRFAVAKVDGDNRLLELVEKPEEPQSDLAVFALYLYPVKTLALLPEYLSTGNSPDSPGHFPEWLLREKRGELYAYITDAPCYDIGTHESLRMVRELYGQ